MFRGLLFLTLLGVAALLSWPSVRSSPRLIQAAERLKQDQWEAFHADKFHTADNHTNQDVFFEGWYYKLIGPYTDDIIVVIPGILINKVNQSSSEAFITVAQNTNVNYYRFPVSQFKSVPQKEGFYVTIGDSTFTDKGLTLSVMPDGDDDAGENAVMGEVSFEDPIPWPMNLFHPSTMGILSYFPGLECFHHVLSMHHKLHGYISVGEQLTDLEMGTGYTEKDWGAKFPDTWIWAQSNHFALLKPPKRGGIEGEVWAESEENKEETAEEGPGAGQSSGAVSALYADHVHNHADPVSLFLAIAKVPLPLPNWALAPLGLTDHSDHSMPGFAAGFYYKNEFHTFAAYDFDNLVRFEIEVVPKDDDKEIVHLSFVDRALTKRLDVQLHKPVQINGAKRRKKDTECLKKAVSMKNRERERLGGNLNPLEEAFLMDDLNKKKAEEEGKTPEETAAIKAAIDAGIAAEKANTPEAKLAELYEKPIPTPAPILASMYGPSPSGKMEKFVKESLIGGRIEVQFHELISGKAYQNIPSKERKVKDWKQAIVGNDIMYSNQVYRAIAKPSAMEVMGDTDWLIDETERRNRDWHTSWFEWLVVGKNAIMVTVLTFAFILIAVVLHLLTSCCFGRGKKQPSKLKSQ